MTSTPEHLTIEGMSCGHCVAAVQRALSAVDGVSVRHVEIGEADVTVDTSVASREKIERAIAAAGFKLTNIILAAFLILAMVGCGDSGTTPVSVNAKLRTVHLAYDGPAVDTRVGGTVTNAAVSYGTSSGFSSVNTGAQSVTIHNTGASTPLISSTASFEEGKTYSVFVFGPAATLSATFTSDEILTSGKARIRFIQGCPDAPVKVDVKAAGTTSLTIATNALYKSIGDYVAVDAGATTLSITESAGSANVVTYEPYTFLANVSYTVVFMGTRQSGDIYPLVTRVFADTGMGSTYTDCVERNDKALVSAVHAVSNGPAVDVSVDANKVVSALSYPTASAYAPLEPGDHTVSVTASGVPVLTTSVTVEAGKAYSVFAVGHVGQAIEALMLTDVTVPNAAQAMVRFVNASPGSDSVDLITNIGASVYEIPGMQHVAYKGVSASPSDPQRSFLYLPAGSYTMKVRKSGTASILAEAADLRFEVNKIYTIWVGGKMGSTPLTVNLITHK